MLYRSSILVSMNKITNEKRSQVIASLVEGNSIRATVRMTGVAKNTITKLLAEVGAACSEYQDKVFRNLKCKRLQCDEIWSFCYSKQKNVPADKQGELGYGDVWTWTAIDADTKLVPCWLVGWRDADYANEFMADLASRLSNRVQLTTDGGLCPMPSHQWAMTPLPHLVVVGSEVFPFKIRADSALTRRFYPFIQLQSVPVLIPSMSSAPGSQLLF